MAIYVSPDNGRIGPAWATAIEENTGDPGTYRVRFKDGHSRRYVPKEDIGMLDPATSIVDKCIWAPYLPGADDSHRKQPKYLQELDARIADLKKNA